DDGPGVHTAELGAYLAAQEIGATFFVVGAHAKGQQEVLRELRDEGHLIGNHTFTHPGLANFARAGGDVVGELTRTHEIIEPYALGPSTYFRPPYGNWRETESPPYSSVAERLNESGQFRGYIGPVNWDITGEDWECWRQGMLPEAAARKYLDEI